MLLNSIFSFSDFYPKVWLAVFEASSMFDEVNIIIKLV